MAGRHSRNKGASFERDCVNTLRSAGISARRTLQSGARNDGTHTHDLDVYHKGEEHAPMIGECKIKAKGMTFLYASLGENDFLASRTDRRETLITMRMDTFIGLIQKGASL